MFWIKDIRKSTHIHRLWNNVRVHVYYSWQLVAFWIAIKQFVVHDDRSYSFENYDLKYTMRTEYRNDCVLLKIFGQNVIWKCMQLLYNIWYSNTVLPTTCDILSSPIALNPLRSNWFHINATSRTGPLKLISDNQPEWSEL